MSGGNCGPEEKRHAARVGMHACNKANRCRCRHDNLSLELWEVVGEGHKWWLWGRWKEQRGCCRCLAGSGVDVLRSNASTYTSTAEREGLCAMVRASGGARARTRAQEDRERERESAPREPASRGTVARAQGLWIPTLIR
jgi:hypothetical protein